MKNNSNQGNRPNDTRLNAISYLWNFLNYYKDENTSHSELLYDTKHMYEELGVIPEMFHVCTKLQKLVHEPVERPGYKEILISIIGEAMEVLQATPN